MSFSGQNIQNLFDFQFPPLNFFWTIILSKFVICWPEFGVRSKIGSRYGKSSNVYWSPMPLLTRMCFFFYAKQLVDQKFVHLLRLKTFNHSESTTLWKSWLILFYDFKFFQFCTSACNFFILVIPTFRFLFSSFITFYRKITASSCSKITIYLKLYWQIVVFFSINTIFQIYCRIFSSNAVNSAFISPKLF